MSRSSAVTDRLHVLERLQELELDQARLERTRLDRQLEEQRERMAALAARIDAVRTLERGLLVSAEGTSVDALRHMRLYLESQAQDVRQQQAVLSQAQIAADQARVAVLDRFKRLSVTRRLRERRTAHRSAQQLRARFKGLDALAIVTKRNAP